MGCVIDTCIIINAERNKTSISPRIVGLEEETFYISAVTASELLYGVHRATNKQLRNKRLAFVEHALTLFPILPNDLSVARIHAEIWSEMTNDGTPVGSHDLWIAAACIAGGHVLLTDNTKDFEKIPGLQII